MKRDLRTIMLYNIMSILSICSMPVHSRVPCMPITIVNSLGSRSSQRATSIRHSEALFLPEHCRNSVC